MAKRKLTPEFREFLACLNRAGVEYLLVGAHSMNSYRHHGLPKKMLPEMMASDAGIRIDDPAPGAKPTSVFRLNPGARSVTLFLCANDLSNPSFPALPVSLKPTGKSASFGTPGRRTSASGISNTCAS